MVENMVGKIFGRLKIVSQYFEKDGSGVNRDFCDCVCECGGQRNHVLGKNIRRGMTVSCGCYRLERIDESCNNCNDFEFVGEVVIGKDSKGREFYFDLDDFERVSKHYWYVDNNGYAHTRTRFLKEYLHNFVLGLTERRRVDHINRMRNDNRKENLRIVTIQQNNINREIGSSNTSGVIGVCRVKGDKERWHSYVINPETRKRINIYSDNFEDAVRQRLILEKEYYGEFSPQQHLFDEYGV